MGKCNNCHITVNDDTHICPLCKCVLTKGAETVNKYPNIPRKRKVLSAISRLYLFCAIVLEGFLIYLNTFLYPEFNWAVIPGCLMACIYLTLHYFVNGTRSSYSADIFFFLIAAITILDIADKLMGNYGWSMNYVQPSLVLATNVLILVLILIHPYTWQGYIYSQLIICIISLVAIPLVFAGQVTKPLVSGISIGISFSFFLGTVILGGSRAKEELYRRFHI